MIRVLAVEDSRTQAAVLCAGLESEGLAVSLATSGDEALGMLDHQEYDVVISDDRGKRVCTSRITCALSSSWASLPSPLTRARRADARVTLPSGATARMRGFSTSSVSVSG